MQAYAAREAAAKAAARAAAKAAGDEDPQEPGFDGWLERLNTLDDFSSEELTQLHGQLIALGFLKFEISGRSVGLRYQISPRGKQAMERAVAIFAEEDERESASSASDEAETVEADTGELATENLASSNSTQAEDLADAA